MTHTITEDELMDYVEKQRQEWTRFAVSSNGGKVKRLDFCIRHVAPVFRVQSEGKDIYIGALKETAVREYNAL